MLLQKGLFLRLLERERETWGRQRADGAAWETGGEEGKRVSTGQGRGTWRSRGGEWEKGKPCSPPTRRNEEPMVTGLCPEAAEVEGGQPVLGPAPRRVLLI